MPDFVKSILSVTTVLAIALTCPAYADVPVKDNKNIKEHKDTQKHWLQSVQTRKGTSKSTSGVRCSWGLTPEGALQKRSDVAAKVANTCSAIGVDPALALSVAFQESQFNQNCIAPTTPHSGGQRAEGVMQVLPSTGQRMFTKAGLGKYNGKNEDQNIKAGCLYLKEGMRITNNSNYHIAGGYHSGYDSKVWRDNLAIPGRWPKTLDYANKVNNRWYPVFNKSLNGYSGASYNNQRLQADGVGSGITAIDSITRDQSILQQRMQEQGQNIGQFPTERLEWVQNSRIRLQNAQATNGFTEALNLLVQFKMLALMNDSTNESEGSSLVNPIPTRPHGIGDDVVLVWDATERRWKMLNPDGSWSWIDTPGSDVVVIDPTIETPTQVNTTTPDAAIARVNQLLQN